MRNSSENKMVGTISNKLKGMSEKEKLRRRLIRLNQMTDNEKKIMAKYGKNWEQVVRETYR